MDTLFRIVFQGAIHQGADPALVRQRAAVRLKVSPAQLDRIFSGPRVVLKQNVDIEQGKAYLRALDQLGMVARLEPMPTNTPAAAPVVPRPAAPAAMVTPAQARPAPRTAPAQSDQPVTIPIVRPVAATPPATTAVPTQRPVPQANPMQPVLPAAQPHKTPAISHFERTQANLARAEALLNASAPPAPKPAATVARLDHVQKELAELEAHIGTQEIPITGTSSGDLATLAARLALREATGHRHDSPASHTEAPIVFTTAIDCAECGTRHIVEGRLVLTITPVATRKQEIA